MFKFDLVPYTRGVGLEAGTEAKTFPHFIRVTLAELKLFGSQVMDYIHLDGSKEPETVSLDALFSAWRLLKENGHLCIDLPKKIALERVGSFFGDPRNKGYQIQERISGDELDFYAIKKAPGQKGARRDPPGKTCAILRYGGIGDMLMASCIFPELAKQGYSITLYTHPNSYEVVKHDPFISRFIIQDPGQVPAPDFFDFCIHTATKFEKFINLSESIEGTLLALPDRVKFYWPKDLRHERCNINYYEITARIAGIEKTLSGYYYDTKAERSRAGKIAKRVNGPVISFIVSGSSTHKVWPWIDNLVAAIMLEIPGAEVFFLGDEASKFITQGWEKEPRVHDTCGKWSVREALSFCKVSDLIITPETGVSLACQFMDVPKILLLSHSSIENYAIDWKNTLVLTPDPEEVPCYPCHQMHYGYKDCNIEEETHTAKCMFNITPFEVMSAVKASLGRSQAA